MILKTQTKSWIVPLVIMGAISFPAKSASEAECGIWLCLPALFPSGCEKQKKAFKRRIKKGKNPLPSLSSCGSANQSLRYRSFSKKYITNDKQCISYRQQGDTKFCNKYHYYKPYMTNGSCPKYNDKNPKFTSYNCKTIRGIFIHENNSQIGSSYYYGQNVEQMKRLEQTPTKRVIDHTK